MKHYRLIYAILIIAALTVSCERSVHEMGDTLAIQLVWNDSSVTQGDNKDSIPAIKDITVFYYDTGGKLHDSTTYKTPETVADDIHPMPAGDYVIVTTSNIKGALSMNKDSASSLSNLRIEAGEGLLSSQAFYSIQWVHVDEKGITVSEQQLRPILAKLQVNVTGVPDGSTLKVEVLNMAKYFYPARINEEGSYGIPGEEKMTFVMPDANYVKGTRSDPDGSINTTSYLMPTAKGETKSLIRITYTTPGNSPSTKIYEVDHMLSGRLYEITLNTHMEITFTSYDMGYNIGGWNTFIHY